MKLIFTSLGDLSFSVTEKWRIFKKYLFLFLLLQFFFFDCYSQTTPVSGTVRDTKGEVLPGVTVRIKNVPLGGAVTDVNGRYTLKVSGKEVVLVFSFIGLKTTEVVVGDKKEIDITLLEDVSDLSEVIVIGYTSAARKDLTGSVGRASVEDIQKAPVRSFDEALAGRVAGVQVVSEDGRPGSPINILIRGIGSITQKSSPLYIIDGFPLENPDNNVLDPDNIESLSVLKDASATSIYGARGSNGVIVITTKRGKKGAPTINYSGSFGMNKVVKMFKLLSPYEFVKLQGEALGAASPYYSNGQILEDYRNSKGTDWQDLLLHDGFQQNHSLSVSGGNEGTLYSISGNSLTQNGIMLNSAYRRYQGKLTLDQKVSDKFKVGGTIAYTGSKTIGRNPTSQGPASIFYNVNTYRPIAVPSGNGNTDYEDLLYDPANLVTDYRINPILSLQNEVRNYTGTNFIGNLYGEYNILKNLKLRVTGGLNSTLTRYDVFDGSQTRKGGPYATSGLGISGSVTNYKSEVYQNANTLEYKTLINKVHSLNVLLGTEFVRTNYSAFSLSGSNIPDEGLGLSGIEAGVLQPSTAVISYSSQASGFSSLNYNYKGKYYVSGTYRADGSSKFRPDNRWSYFPSGAIKWKFSEERFFKKITFVSDANIRASYGITGNNRVSDFASYAALGFNSPLTLNGMMQPNSAIVSNLANPGLMWESAASTNIGLDLGFLKNRFNLTVEYYKKVTSNLLYQASLPGSTGYLSAIKNIGKISNRGIEVTLNARIIETKQLTWNSNFNITFNRNRLEALSNPDEEAVASNVSWEALFTGTPAFIAKIGQPLGQIYGMIWEGFYKYSDFDKLPNGTYVLKGNIPTNALAANRAATQPGSLKFRDLNNDGQINESDRTIIGRGYPIHQGGLSNNFRYKNFDLNVFLQWSYGTNIINANRMWFEQGLGVQQRGAGQETSAAFANRWTPNNQNTDIPAYLKPSYYYSTEYLEDGSYIRLKTINLGYSLPDKFLNKLKIKKLRVYIAASNLYTLTKYKGYDPEVSTYQSGLTPGVDWSAYPRPLNITGGINLTL